MSQITTIIDLIRHGEPVGGSKYRGHIDDPLSEKGWQQMREAVADHSPWQQLVSSPLVRCSAFASKLAERHGLPISFDERFKEIGFGEWEGSTKDDISAKDPQALHRFYSDPIAHRPPGAEPLESFRARIDAAWQEMVRDHAGKHLLLVAHAGVIRMILCQVLNCPVESMFRIYVPNAGVTRIRIDGEGDTALASMMFHAGQL